MKTDIKTVLKSGFELAIRYAENEIEKDKLVKTAYELGIKIETK